MTDQDGLTRLVVNLVPEAVAALDQAAEVSGDTRTVVVNRALQLYRAFVVEVQAENRQVIVRNSDGSFEEMSWT